LPVFTQALPDTRNIGSHQPGGKPSMAIALMADASMMIKGETPFSYRSAAPQYSWCWIKKMIFEKTEVLFAMENNLYL